MVNSETLLNSQLTIDFHYSVRKDFTGLAIAALIAWKLRVMNAINRAVVPAITKTDQPILIRYAKSLSQLFIKYHANGDAITMDNKTSFRKSFESKPTITDT